MLQILSFPVGDACGMLTEVVGSIRQLSLSRNARLFRTYTSIQGRVLLQFAGDSVTPQFVFPVSRSGVNPCA